MSTVADTFVKREVTVAVPPERAFEVFTSGMGSWWPRETHHIGKEIPVDIVIEPHVGGRCFERAADGTECQWGFVTEWSPPERFAYAWHLTSAWEFDPDPDSATEVEVRFIPDGDSTRVVLEHRHLERFADKADEMREVLGSDNGWNGLLKLFKEAAETA
jgi:uncharacterized protein YndB with AHSA1/START domain